MITKGGNLDIEFSPSYLKETQDYFLMEVSNEFLKDFQGDGILKIKSNYNDENAYIVSNSKSYKMKKSLVSNTLCPNHNGNLVGLMDFYIELQDYKIDYSSLYEELRSKVFINTLESFKSKSGVIIEELMEKFAICRIEMENFIHQFNILNDYDELYIIDENFSISIFHEFLLILAEEKVIMDEEYKFSFENVNCSLERV